MTKEIPVSKGKCVVLVDDEDYETVNKWKWTLMNGYAMRTQYFSYDSMTKKQNRRSLPMHRELMGDPPGLTIDHINGNKLDNRRVNLRICTHQQNSRNRKKADSKSEYGSIYKGVQKQSRRKTEAWTAHISLSGRLTVIGTYASEVEAAIAYNQEAVKHFGAFAKLNTIEPALLEKYKNPQRSMRRRKLDEAQELLKVF